jgi:uncharacterized protein YhjY with autotransporter beta-barrel domain
MKLVKKSHLYAFEKFLSLVVLCVIVQSSAYAICNPSVTPNPVTEGQSVTFSANCDATTTTNYIWTAFNQIFDSSPSPSVNLTVPKGFSGLQVVTLSNTGQAQNYQATFTVNNLPTGSLVLSPETYYFGALGIGYFGTKTFVVSNQGPNQVGVSAVQVQGANSADFTISQNDCAQLLLPNSLCVFTVRFSPSAAGKRIAKIVIVDDDPSYEAAISLEGGGQNLIVNGALSVSPSPQVFVNVNVGQTAEKQLIFSNTLSSGGIFIGSSPDIVGNHPTDFNITQNCIDGIDWIPTETCVETITFRPSAAGNRNAVIVYRDAYFPDGTRGILNVPVSGDAVISGASTLIATPSRLAFNSTKIGATAQLSLKLQNTLLVNQGALISLTLSGADFTQTNDCNVNPIIPALNAPTLAKLQDKRTESVGRRKREAADGCTVTVTFAPTELGERAAELKVADVEGNALTIPILGSAVAVTSPLVATPASLAFGATKIGTPAVLTVKLKNTALADQGTFTSLVITGTDFTQTNDCTLVALSVGTQLKSKTALPSTVRRREALDGCIVTVTFLPSVVGARTAELKTTDAQGNTLVVPITGEAVERTGLTEAQVRQIATEQITANLRSMQIGLQTQLSNVNKRLRYLRFQDSIPAFRQEIDLDVNGKNLPLPGGGGGACGSSGGRDGAGATGDREQCQDDYKGAQNGRWGTYIAGGVGVNENTLNGVKINSNGITVGGDYRLGGKSAAGAAFGAMKSSTNMAGEAGKQDATGYSFVAYGSFAPTQSSFFDVALTAGNGKFDLQRIEAVGTTAVADTTGNGLGLSLTAGADWRNGGWAVTPYGRAEYVKSKIKAFTESGTEPITVSDQSMTSNFLSLGIELQYTASTSRGIFIPHTRIEYQNQSQSAADGKAQAVGSTVQLTVSPELNQDKTSGNVAIGASAQFGKGKTGFLDFEKTFGKENFKDRRISAGYKVEF